MDSGVKTNQLVKVSWSQTPRMNVAVKKNCEGFRKKMAKDDHSPMVWEQNRAQRSCGLKKEKLSPPPPPPILSLCPSLVLSSVWLQHFCKLNQNQIKPALTNSWLPCQRQVVCIYPLPSLSQALSATCFLFLFILLFIRLHLSLSLSLSVSLSVSLSLSLSLSLFLSRVHAYTRSLPLSLPFSFSLCLSTSILLTLCWLWLRKTKGHCNWRE